MLPRSRAADAQVPGDAVNNMVVQLTVEELRELIRSELRAAKGDERKAEAPAPVLNSEEAARYLAMPVAVLRKRTAKGEVPSFKIGAVLRYRRAELDEWIAN